MEDLEENSEKKFNYFDWVEKYRPTKLSNILLPKAFKDIFSKILEKGELPNMIFNSTIPGTGKSSLAKVLCRELGANFLYKNISMETGIDVLRGTIQSFSSVRSISGKKKYIILDEFERASQALQDGLKAFTEEHYSSCKFIFLTNNINKIIEPLREPGRCMVFDFNMSSKDFREEMIPKTIKYLKSLLNYEKVTFEEGSIEALVEKNYPSLRTCISLLQTHYLMYGVISKKVSLEDELGEEFYEMILTKKFESARKFVLEKGIPFQDIYGILYRKFLPKVPSSKKGEVIKILDEQLYKSSLVVDPEITFASCLIKIMGVL